MPMVSIGQGCEADGVNGTRGLSGADGLNGAMWLSMGNKVDGERGVVLREGLKALGIPVPGEDEWVGGVMWDHFRGLKGMLFFHYVI